MNLSIREVAKVWGRYLLLEALEPAPRWRRSAPLAAPVEGFNNEHAGAATGGAGAAAQPQGRGLACLEMGDIQELLLRSEIERDSTVCVCVFHNFV